MKNFGSKVFRFIMALVVGFSVANALKDFVENKQWGFFWLTIMILALGFAIMVCVWDLIDFKDESKDK
jgi:undecaprenyl pyrophosphate phosphatase UppP